nr:MAG: hypothetical protein [Bacteriophage sp.]
MPTLKERIQSLTSHINEAKTSLRDALRNKGVDPGSQPSFEAIRLGIEGISSGDKYKELIGKGSIFSTKLDTNETARKMVMAPDKSTFSIKVNCKLDSIQSALDEINGSFYKGDLVVIVTYAMPMDGNHGLCIYNLSEDLFSWFFGYGSSTSIENGYPWVENALFLESVNITAVNTGRYNFSFTGYPLKVGKSLVD